MRGGKVCGKWRDTRSVLMTLVFMSLSCLMAGAVVSCGSESPTEPSKKISQPAPVVEKAESREESPAKGEAPASTASSGTVPAGGDPQAPPAREEVTPMHIKSILLTPERPIAGDVIKAEVVLEKPETAAAVLHYQWKVNDETVTDANKDTLEYRTKRGDRVEVSVFVGDWLEDGRARRANVVVDNAPPVVKKVEDHLGANGEYVAQLETSDPDGDTVDLKLQRGPADMKLDSATKQLRWSLPEGTNGAFDVEVVASDPAGANMVLSYVVTIRQQQQSRGGEANATATVSRSQ
jgi:hypothetical protein